MVNKIHISLFGQGLGHATRMSNVAEELRRRGVKVTFSASEEALDYLKMKRFPIMKVPSLDVGWKEDAFSLSRTLPTLPSNCITFLHQVSSELRIMKALRPDRVISDSRLSALLAARLLSIQSYLVINQLRLLLPPSINPGRLSIFEEAEGEILGSLWSLSNEILIPDLPPPFTISERSLWKVRTAQRRLKYVGFALPGKKLSERAIEDVSSKLNLEKGRPTLFAHISGPRITKKRIVRVLLSLAKTLSSSYNLILSEGNPNGDPVPKRAEGFWHYEWCPEKDSILALADVIIVRGGHTSISQAILEGKPMIVVPIENHSEQVANADKVVKLNIGLGIKERDLSQEAVSAAIRLILEGEEYRKRAIYLMQIARKLDGISNIVNAVLS